MEAENKPQPKKFSVPEAILLAAASAGVYLFAFTYERGYTGYFGIPAEFINISLVTLLIFGAATFTFLYITTVTANASFPMMQSKHPYLAHYVPRLSAILFLVVLVPFTLYQGHRWKQSAFMFGMWLIMALVYFVGPLVMFRKKGDISKRYAEAWKREVEGSTVTPLDLVGSRFGIRNPGLILYLFLISVVLANSAGDAAAVNQKEFLVTNTEPSMVVLRVYGDNIICSPFDRNSRQVKKSFSILKMGENNKLVMNLESIGPLTPVDKLASENVLPSPPPSPTLVELPSPTPPANNPETPK